ncbi:MAG: GIY-YIG nuclease family protein [Carnobacterium sp.]|uniref:GIY-YIG nuclease family protein n=1 Tax=Carnobacterium antarcticum TaxID=2126436 RepID=A0ABW4NNV1_9LACT|nr:MULTISPECIES: GIY-YIG nuclease family protein [unclassified Carnobacterium]ALV22512.1 endonuclease containing a URI domain [Carnobacterium sp. CP1]QQP70431.1 GIY-YIG nuclease family protein [Carnobacterium sp. CS13]
MAKTISYFYVLYCRDGSFYGGYTTDLTRREQEHNEGVGAKYTRPAGRRPVKLIYAEAFNTRSEATKAEYAFKKQTRQKKERFLGTQGVQFPIDENQPRIVNSEQLSAEEEKENAESKEL